MREVYLPINVFTATRGVDINFDKNVMQMEIIKDNFTQEFYNSLQIEEIKLYTKSKSLKNAEAGFFIKDGINYSLIKYDNLFILINV